MVREVAKCLHRLAPTTPRYRRPASIAVEFLILVDVRLDQRLLSAVSILPDLGRIEYDLAVDNVRGVPLVDNALRALNDVELFVEVVVSEDRATFELLRHAGLSRAWAGRVASTVDVFAGAGCEEAVVDYGLRGVVVS